GAAAAPCRRALVLGWLLADRRRRRYGDGPGRAWPSFGALHVLSAADRQRVLLHRRRAGGGGLLDLGRADVDQPARLEAGPSGQAGAARDVRERGRILPVGLDVGRRGA